MHAPSVTGPATCQDVLDAPANRIAQIIGGRLHLHPVFEGRRSWALQRLVGLLSAALDRPGPGGWHILRRVEVHLSGNVLVPDVAAWRRGVVPPTDDPPWIEVAPEWACEVISDSTRRLDITAKREAYQREGVRHLWFVHPDAHVVEVFELRDNAWTLLTASGGDAPVRLPPFENVEWSQAPLWAH